MLTLEYTVQQLATMSGVSKRTLHYYDEIGLLQPKKIRSNGYRIYGSQEVNRLQQILFFKTFGLSLNEIQTIMSKEKAEIYQALQIQQMKLIQQKNAIEQQLYALTQTLQNLKGENTMTDNEKFNYFKQQKLIDNEEKYGQEIREKYGDEQVNQANQKWQQLTKEQFKQMQQAEEQLIQALNQLLTQPHPLPNALAKQAFINHRTWLSIAAPFYSREYHRSLAEMYVADERFAAYYNQKTVAPSVELIKMIIDYYTQNTDKISK